MVKEFNCVTVVFRYQLIPVPASQSIHLFFEGDRAAAKVAFNEYLTLAEKGTGRIQSLKWERDYSVDGADIEDDAFETVAQWPAHGPGSGIGGQDEQRL